MPCGLSRGLCALSPWFVMHPNKLFLLSCCFALCGSAVAISASADAERPADDSVHLEKIVVTASPYARNQAAIAQPTSVLAGQALTFSQSNTLGELLAGEPGVSSTYFGPGASRPVIRGLGGDRIRLLTDGSGTLDASVISPDHAVSLDPMLIERVEVVRGPATLLYGGSAVGGVVNVIDHRVHTTRPEEPFNARLETRHASVDDGKSGGVLLEGGSGAIAWHLDGYRRASSDVRVPGFAESARVRAEEEEEAEEHGEEPPEPIRGYIPNTSLTADGGAVSVSFIGSAGYVGLVYSGHNTLYGVPAGAHEHAHHDEEEEGEEHETEAESVRIDLRQRRLDLQGALTQPFGLVRETRVKIGTARYQHTELEGDAIGTVFRNRGYDGRVEFLHAAIGPFTGTFGWHGGRSDFEAVGDEAFLPPSRTDNHAAFILEEMERGALRWQGGARVERQKIELRDGSRDGRDRTSASLSTGLVWNLDDTWTLGTSLSHTERAANAQELFAHGPHFGTSAYEIGSGSLGAEKSLAADLTLRKRTGFVTGSLTVFSNRFEGYIYERPTGLVAVEHDGEFEFLPPDDPEAEGGGLAVYEFVQHDARFYGAELETIVHLLHEDRAQLDLTLSGDFVRAQNSTLDTALPRITPARLKAGLTWTLGPWTLGGDVQRVQRQDRVATYEMPTHGYTLIGAYAAYRWALGRSTCALYVRATNLGDEEARVHTSSLKEVAPLPGRNFVVGLQAAF